ncbi:MAG TPA: hypothetical protein VLC79_10850 [Cellvibrio sp.]|nr:hypothetical protein [Cellvibrio sp.]
MDNITPLVPSTDSNCVVTLNSFQNIFYQQSRVEIHSSDGDHLETIGRDIQKENLHNNDIRLRDQICLVESLLGNVNQDIELPAQAVCGLAELLYRMQEFCERKIG